MLINHRTSLFFDASVLVAGSHSLESGSALILEACRKKGFTAQVSLLIVLEAVGALQKTFPQESFGRLKAYLAEIDWEVLPVPEERLLNKYSSLIDAKDPHVLVAALEGGSDFLLTLDKKHILAAAEAVERNRLPLKIIRPGDFIQQYYPLHQDYPSLPPRRGK